MTRDEWRGVPGSTDPSDDDNNPFKTIQKYQKWIMGAGAIAGLVGFALGWFLAPPVGGEWWPYIRIVVSLLSAGILYAVVANLIGYLLVNNFLNEFL